MDLLFPATPSGTSMPHCTLESARLLGERLVREAGAQLRGFYGQVTARTKGPFDVVTEADTAIEKFIAGELKRHFPEDGFLGEEGVDIDSQPGPALRRRQWILDPLDGTVNFANGQPFFAVSLALLIEGHLQLAWVYDPVHDELFAAVAGGGATCNGQVLQRAAAEVTSRSATPFALSSGLLASPAAEHRVLCQAVLRECGRIRLFGSQALHLCYVAAGRLRGAASLEARLWDDAAGALIVSESGHRYSKLSGEQAFPIKEGDPALRGQATGSLAGSPELLALLQVSVQSIDPPLQQPRVQVSP